jgi:hypothetical protein
MKLCQNRRDEAARRVVPDLARKLRDRDARGPLHEDRIIVMGENARCAMSTPPGHQGIAAPFLVQTRDLEHRPLNAPAHRQKGTGRRDDGLAIRLEPPTAEVIVDHHRLTG